MESKHARYIRILKAVGLVGIIALSVVIMSASAATDLAFELSCPHQVTVIISPASGMALQEARRIAECMGARSEVCTIQSIRIRRK